MLSAIVNNPIFVRSRRVESRRSRGWLCFVARYLGATLVLLMPLLLSLACEIYSEGAVFFEAAPSRLLELTSACMAVSAFLLPVFVLARSLNNTFGAFSQEREKQTLDSMLGTRLTSDEILIGKLAAGVWPVWREWAIASPLVLAFGFVLGHPGPALVMVLLTFLSALFFGVLGLWASAGAASSAQANRRASMTTMLVLFGGPLISLALGISDHFNNVSDTLPLMTSPLAASTSMMAMASLSKSDALSLVPLGLNAMLFGLVGWQLYLIARRRINNR